MPPTGNSSSIVRPFAADVGLVRLGLVPQDQSTYYPALGGFFPDDDGSDTE